MYTFSQEDAIIPASYVRHVEMMMSHHVHTQNNGQNDQSLNLLQCSLWPPWQR